MDIRYWGRALRSLGRHVPHRQFTRQWLTAGLAADAAPRALSAHIFEVYPEIEGCRIPMGDVEYRIFNMDPLERYCLASLAAVLRPRTIFEIGTYGVSFGPFELDRSGQHLELAVAFLNPDALGPTVEWCGIL